MILELWRRLFFKHLNLGRIEYNPLFNSYSIDVVNPGQVVEDHGNARYVVFLTSKTLEEIYDASE